MTPFVLITVAFCLVESVYSQNINCSTGENCQVYCSSRNCTNLVINGTLASSLYVSCFRNCHYSKILCPARNYSSCSIYCYFGSCLHANIEAVGDNTMMSSMSLNCYSANACEHITLSLETVSISYIDVYCRSQHSCRYSTFNIKSSEIYYFKTGCYDFESCSSSKYIIDSNSSINRYYLDCGNTHSFSGGSHKGSCRDIMIDIASTSIDTMNWRCLDSESCQDSILDASNGIIDRFEVLCLDDRACYNININSQINSTTDIRCGYFWGENEQICSSANISLTSVSPQANFSVRCGDPIENSTFGACQDSLWYIHGYSKSNGDKYNNLTVGLYGYDDFYNSSIYAQDLYIVDIECDDSYSCSEAVIDVRSSLELDLNCIKEYACSQTVVYCPYGDENKCDITCSNGSEVCHGIDIRSSTRNPTSPPVMILSTTTVGCDPLICNDGDYCNGEETCITGKCIAGTPIDCGFAFICDSNTAKCVRNCDSFDIDGYLQCSQLFSLMDKKINNIDNKLQQIDNNFIDLRRLINKTNDKIYGFGKVKNAKTNSINMMDKFTGKDMLMIVVLLMNVIMMAYICCIQNKNENAAYSKVEVYSD